LDFLGERCRGDALGLRSLSFFKIDNLLNLKRKFCADVLLHDQVRLRPEESVTFGYLFPKILKSQCATTVLYGDSGVADFYLDKHFRDIEMGRRLHPELSIDHVSAWAAHKGITSIHPIVIRKIDSQYRSGRIAKHGLFRQYQKFDSLIAYLESEFKQFSVVRAPFELSTIGREKLKLSKLAGIDVHRGWARSFFSLTDNVPQDEQDLEASDAMNDLQNLIELVLWRKSDPETILAEDQTSWTRYSRIFCKLSGPHLPADSGISMRGTVEREFLADISRGRHHANLVKLTQMQIADMGLFSDEQILKLRKKSSSRLRRLLNKLVTKLEEGNLNNAADARREIAVSQLDLSVSRDIASVYRQFNRAASEQLEKEIDTIEKVRKGVAPIRRIQSYGGDLLFLLPLVKTGLNVARSWYGVPLHIGYGYDDIAAMAVSAAATGERMARWGNLLLGDLIGKRVGLDFYFAFRKFPKA
jgi:hypothetical protein